MKYVIGRAQLIPEETIVLVALGMSTNSKIMYNLRLPEINRDSTVIDKWRLIAKN
jgi:hypothetical protein